MKVRGRGREERDVCQVCVRNASDARVGVESGERKRDAKRARHGEREFVNMTKDDNAVK